MILARLSEAIYLLQEQQVASIHDFLELQALDHDNHLYAQVAARWGMCNKTEVAVGLSISLTSKFRRLGQQALQGIRLWQS